MQSILAIILVSTGLTLAVQPPTKISIQIPEEMPNGTRFQNLKDKIIQSGPYSHDMIRDSKLQLMPESDYFGIDDTGYIISKSRIDREAICHEVVSRPCKLTLNIIQRFHNQVSFIELEIEIIDINDNAPSWDSQYISLLIPEHTPVGKTFALPTARDVDRGPVNTTVSYRIKKHNNDFILDSEMVSTDGFEPRKFKLWLKVNQDLDRELVQSYQLILLAMDGGFQSLTGSVTLNITITDINDQQPVFLTNNPTITVPEDSPRGTTIFKLKASDKDPSDANRLTFQMGSSANSAILNLFNINNKTGDVSLKKELDYETTNRYLLPVVVTDGKHIVETILSVNVSNVNDNPPVISLMSMSADKKKFSVKENEILNFLVATVFVEDGDDKEGKEKIQCQMESNEFLIQPLFPNSKNKFKIATNQKFDREKKSEYYAKIICFDNGQPRKSASRIFQVNIIDENDNSPYFVPKEMTKEVDENISIGSIIYTVEARDNDEGENKKILYSFPVGDEVSRYFSIDKFTGVIKNQIQFNKEDVGEYHLKIIARDRGSSPINDATSPQVSNSIQGVLKILIKDVNDCPPVFEQPTYHFSVKEGSKENNKPIGTVRAHDDDVDEGNKRIVYFMKNDKGNHAMEDFRVSPHGQIFPRRDSLDRESTPSYSFYVVARDEGSPPLSTSVNVQVNVIDINDNQPQWIFPSETNRAVNITYRSPVGHQVTKMSAVDRDEGVNAEIRYTILKSKSNLFELDSSTGALYVAKTMTVNDIGIVKLFIEARDRGNPEKYSHQVLDVNIVAKLETFMSSGKLASDVIIIIIMVAITLVVSMILIGAILFLRCRCCNQYSSKRYRQRRNYSPDGNSPVHEMRNSYSQNPHTLSSYMLPSIDSDRQLTCGSKFLCDIDSVSVDSGRGCSSDTTIGKKVDTFSRKSGMLSGTMKSNEQSIKEWAADTTRKTLDMANASRYQSILTSNQAVPTVRQRTMEDKQGIGSRARLSVTFVEPEYQTCNHSGNRSEEILSSGVADDSDTSEERYGHISETGGPHFTGRGLPMSNSCNQISTCQPVTYSTYTPLQQFQAGNQRITSPNLYTKLPASFV